jgi:uncharacterized membrane protein (UPF0182 family)
MLYIEPVYIQSNANNVYPLMKKVLLNFGQYVAFEDTIAQGINSLIAQASGTPPPTGSVNPPPTGGGNGGLSAAVSQINKALSDLKAAQASGNFADYGKALQELQDAINAYNQAVAASGGGTASPAPKPSG